MGVARKLEICLGPDRTIFERRRLLNEERKRQTCLKQVNMRVKRTGGGVQIERVQFLRIRYSNLKDFLKYVDKTIQALFQIPLL